MPDDKSFWWFEGQSVERLLANLLEAGPGARLEVHPYGPDKLHLVVVPEGRVSHDPINESHICPPECP